MPYYNKLANKHVLVIGGSNGIGRGVAEAALASGARVTITGSSAQSAEKALSEITQAASSPALIKALPANLSSKETIEEDLSSILSQAASLQGQPIDHIVLTAADGLTLKPLDDLTPEIALGAAHMRLVVPLMMGKVAGRYFRENGKGEGEDGDRTLTLTTGGIAEHPAKDWSLIAYLCSGIYGLTMNLALDLSPLRVRVNAVSPGAINTGLWDPFHENPEARKTAMAAAFGHLPTGRIGAVEDVAEAYMYLLRDRNATGEVVRTRGGAQLI
ncbi:short-chain dehydrogenase [Xylariaceae sp. FL0255]|nr:short-chain dehydrogenase [Xylariaceae sp. FL0255]